MVINEYSLVVTMNYPKYMNRIFIPILLICAFFRLDALAGKSQSQEKLNILMIIVDDLNTQVGCFDGPAVTPNIDALAAKGVQFNNAYSACPSCNPSRTSMFTGQRPERNGVFSNSQHFRETEPAKYLTTLPQLLMANGYNTISAGKIFHNRRGTKPEPSPLSDPISWTFQASIDAELFFGNDFKKEFLDENGAPLWVKRTTGKIFEGDEKALKSTWSYGPIDVPPTRTLDFNTAEFGAAFLTGDMSHPEVAKAPNPNEKPFFLACGIFRPHIPILAPREFFELYENDENAHRLELPELPDDDIDDLPKASGAGRHWYVRYLKDYPEEQRRLRHAYLAATSYADAAVGVILDGLKNSTFADNTVVILIGDHGYQLGEKDRLGKAAVWRGSSRTPMVIRIPNGEIGKSGEPVSLIDIYPTILDLLNLKSVHHLDGESLVPLLEDPEAGRNIPAVISNTGGTAIGIVQDNWHYINYTDGSEELYDHGVDATEWKNLLHPDNYSEKYAAIAKRLRKYIPENRGKR